MKKNGLVWNFLEPQAVETSDHTNKTNKYLHHPNTRPFTFHSRGDDSGEQEVYTVDSIR